MLPLKKKKKWLLLLHNSHKSLRKPLDRKKLDSDCRALLAIRNVKMGKVITVILYNALCNTFLYLQILSLLWC